MTPALIVALIMAGAAGLIIGARFRAPAIVVATFAVVTASVVTGVVSGSSLKLILLRTLYPILTLQGCYLVGLGLTALFNRATNAPPNVADTSAKRSARQADVRKPDRNS